jgi:hypothetical protein
MAVAGGGVGNINQNTKMSNFKLSNCTRGGDYRTLVAGVSNGLCGPLIPANALVNVVSHDIIPEQYEESASEQ